MPRFIFPALDSGIVPINRGGTSSTTAPDALVALGAVPLSSVGQPNGVAGLDGTGNLPGNILENANAATASALQTARTISMVGDGTWSVSFKGDANISGSLSLANIGVTAGTYNNNATQIRPFTIDSKGRIVSIEPALNITADWNNVLNKPTTLSGYGITDGTSLSNAGPVVAGIANPGVATQASRADHVHPAQTSITGNAATASALQTARNINGTPFTGNVDITTNNWGTARNITIGNTTKSVNGAANITWTLAEIGASGANIVDDVSTNGIRYPLFVDTTTGLVDTVNTSGGKLQYNPSTGELFAVGFDTLSDERYKTNIEPIQNSLDMVSRLNGYTFTYAETGMESAGVIAQEVLEVLPCLVTDINNKYSVNYNGLVGLLIESIKELRLEVNNLKSQLNGG